MARSDQSDSDPLPFVQVHRSVKQSAALLAGVMGASLQHAIGSLVGFWELNGDVRELERIVRSGDEQAVVLSGEELQMRFYLASGHKVEAPVLAALGFVEAREDRRYRVRGMSRQIETVAERLRLRDAGMKGGKASAALRRQRHGTAQPGGAPQPVENPENMDAARSGVDSGGAQAPVEALPKHPPKHSRSTDRSTPEAPPNQEVRGKRLEGNTRGSLPSPLEEDRGGGAVEDKKPNWDQVALDFVVWAMALTPELAKPGPDVYGWAKDFFRKYQPTDTKLVRGAFVKFLRWCHDDRLTVGWGLWLREAVWFPRWAEVRAEAQAARGAA